MKKLLLSNVCKLLFLMLLTNNIINAQVTPTFSAISPICSGGALSPLPTTSNNGITGTWAPAVNNLVTTTYFFTPTAGQNANITTLTIIVNSVPAPTFITTQPTCSNPTGTIQIASPTGAGFTYSIDGVSFQNANTFSNLPSSTYNVVVKNSLGCISVSSSATINNAPTLPVFIQQPQGLSTICAGQDIDLIAETTGVGVSYKWFKGMIDLSTSNPTALTNNLFIPNAQTTNSGDYYCVASNCGSVTSNFATITVTAIDTTLNLVGSTITSNQANATYQWIDCANGNATIVGQNSQSFTPTTNGQYAVNIQYNNCISTSECINIDFLEIDHFKNTSNVHVFPNPTASFLNIQTEEKIIDVKIIDIIGRTTSISNFTENKIDVSNLSSGMYFVAIKTEKGWLKEKFIKN